MRAVLALTVAGLTTSFVAADVSREQAMPSPQELLRSVAQFTDAEWGAVERGEAVAKVLDTDTREVAVAGAVRVNGMREMLIDRYRDVDVLKQSPIVLDASRFSPAPQASDLIRVPFEDRSLDLRTCRPGDCQVRLSATDIARFQRDVNWQSAEWRTQSAAIWREVLAGYAAAYLGKGRAGLPEYVNKPESLSVASELALLIGEYGVLTAYSPELHAYLKDFGPSSPAGAEHMLYWTKEDFGVRPIFRISHQMIVRTTRMPCALIVTNQVYADHYLDAALGVTIAVDAGRDFYMIAMNRARTRSLSGLLRRLVRSTVQSRSRDGMRKMLTATKIAIEKQRRQS
jgi:hypothetical protein